MKTDDLIDVLSAKVEPADRGKLWRALAGALVVGIAAAFAAMAIVLGVRPDALDMAHRGFILMKLFFTLSVIALAVIFLNTFARPVVERRKTVLLLTAPFVAIVFCAILVLMSADRTNWGAMVLGREWLTCIICIPFLAVAPYIALVWVLRRTGAPTDLIWTGAIAGLVAGGIGATAYALHCPDDSLLFVAVWYGMTIGLCAFIGAKLGPRLLRW
jgi:hypothetical protein